LSGQDSLFVVFTDVYYRSSIQTTLTTSAYRMFRIDNVLPLYWLRKPCLFYLRSRILPIQ